MSEAPIQIKLTSLPSLPLAYLRALFARKGTPTRPTPVIVAALSGLRFDAARLGRYCTELEIPTSEHLPILYPQVVTAAAFAELILIPAFPFRPLGLVHRRTTVAAMQPLPVAAAYEASFRIQVAHDTEQGTEVDFSTELTREGALAWRGTATVLVRAQGAAAKRRATQPPPPALDGPGTRVVAWPVSSDVGRRYARVSGDYNPIHLSAWSARLFGYRRAIAHGMWTLARAFSELEHSVTEPMTVEASFKRPLFLPASVLCWVRAEPQGVHFGVRDAETGVPHLVAQTRGST